MTAWLRQLLVFTTAFLLVGPPGMCCRVGRINASEPTGETQSGCCQPSRPAQPFCPTDNSPVPAGPSKVCCCQADLFPVLASPITVDGDFDWPTFSGPIQVDLTESAGDPPLDAFISSPSPRVLQCVWRC